MFGLRVALMLGLAAVVAGCNRPQMKSSSDRQNEAIDKMGEKPQEQFRHMADNAMLYDMVISDIHFVPHTSELSGSGVVKLDRIAPMLDTYGGVLNYDTSMTDTSLIQSRIQHVREYLALAGCSMEKVEVKPGLAMGRGMPADRAMQIEQRDLNPKAGKSGPAPAVAAPTKG